MGERGRRNDSRATENSQQKKDASWILDSESATSDLLGEERFGFVRWGSTGMKRPEGR